VAPVNDREWSIGVTITASSKLAQVVDNATGTHIAECYQCGKCTAGCPMAKRMDLAPSQIMRLVQAGDDEAVARVLSSGALWMCIGCLTCTQRCPKKQDPAAVIDALRELAYVGGTVPTRQKKILAFHKAFLKTVEKTGRMSEIRLTVLYKMTSGDLLRDLLMAPRMLLRGKLRMSKAVRGRGDMERLFRACCKETPKKNPSPSSAASSSPKEVPVILRYLYPRIGRARRPAKGVNAGLKAAMTGGRSGRAKGNLDGR
jgi:heterodisulfide reductase subunit C